MKNKAPMKNIQNDSDYSEIRKRILARSSSSPRKWGKMNLQQMLVHCTTQLKMSLGELTSKAQGPAFMRTRLGKWLIFSTIPWPKGAATPDEMNMEKNEFLLTEIENQKTELLHYLEKAKTQVKLFPHPFFGELSRKEWSRMIYKHLDHHLRQFGSL